MSRKKDEMRAKAAKRASREKPDATSLQRARWRLLQALAEPGASAARNELDDDASLIVRARKNGVTMLRTRIVASVGDAAVSEGLAAWSQEGAPRLFITAAGRAWLRRAGAPQAANPFHAQHAEYESLPMEKGARPALINAAESPLAWLARRKDRDGRPFLNRAQLEAGERLRRDFEQAQLLERVTANWEAPTGSTVYRVNRGAVSEVAMDARRRVKRAFLAVGSGLIGILVDVCGYLKSLGTIERELGLRPRSAKLLLRIALEELVRHYGIGVEAKGPARAKGVTHWGAEDYRPRM